MKLLITGATGFLGRYVVAEALRRGHQVIALTRRDVAETPANVTFVRADLHTPGDLSAALAGVDTVIHLASAKSGDLKSQMAVTVDGTRHLMTAMHEAKVDRLIVISSFSVFDYQHIPTGSIVDEASPLVAVPAERDAYCQAKLAQEQLVTRSTGFRWTVLRPGVIFGPGNEYTSRLGMKLGANLWLRIGAGAILPLTYVENCAQAIVLAAESDAAIGKVLNIVDDQTLTQQQYARLLQQRLRPRPRVIPVAYTLMRILAGLATGTNRRIFRGKAKLPQILRTPSLMARCKPLRYTNVAAKKTLGWQPRFDVEQGLDRCFNGEAAAAMTPTDARAMAGHA
ncbi:MAG: NAD(P)H-binding protein [Planctomycetes bacterium]|nr:NAD(P)H-binding protein [Planctomycetota bacterium]